MSDVIGSELIKLIAGVLIVMLPLIWSNRNSNRKVEKKLGDPNGYESIVKMIEGLDDKVTNNHAEISAHQRDMQWDMHIIRAKQRAILDHLGMDK